MHAEINLLGEGAVVHHPHQKPGKSALGGAGKIHINDAVAHLEILQSRRGTIEHEALATQKVSGFGFSFEQPARGVGRNGEWWGLGKRWGDKKKGENTKSQAH